MTGKKSSSGSNLTKIDAHLLTDAEYAESPELDANWFAAAELKQNGVPVKRGRPAGSGQKEQATIRLDREILRQFRATGPGWQTRMNTVLKQWLEDHPGLEPPRR
jgi:uncharacterized protein (DUF4415 family)